MKPYLLIMFKQPKRKAFRFNQGEEPNLYKPYRPLDTIFDNP